MPTSLPKQRKHSCLSRVVEGALLDDGL